MAKFGSKSIFKELLFSKVTLVVLLIMALYLSVSVYERYTVEREMAGRLSDTYERRDNLELRRDMLLEKVEYLQGDSGIESEIRKHFDVAREGEQVVIIVDDENGEQEEVKFVNGFDPDMDDGKPWWRFW